MSGNNLPGNIPAGQTWTRLVSSRTLGLDQRSRPPCRETLMPRLAAPRVLALRLRTWNRMRIKRSGLWRSWSESYDERLGDATL